MVTPSGSRPAGSPAAPGLGASENGLYVDCALDDDLQHPPEEIPKLLAKLEEGHDVVYGTPTKGQHGFWRRVASRLTRLALRSTMRTQTALGVSAFRAFRSKLLEAFAGYQGPFVSIDVLLTWVTARFVAVPMRHDARPSGASNYTFGKLVSHAITMRTGFSALPLRIASFVGFCFTLFGFCVLAFVIGRYFLEGGSVAGFPFTEQQPEKGPVNSSLPIWSK